MMRSTVEVIPLALEASSRCIVQEDAETKPAERNGLTVSNICRPDPRRCTGQTLPARLMVSTVRDDAARGSLRPARPASEVFGRNDTTAAGDGDAGAAGATDNAAAYPNFVPASGGGAAAGSGGLYTQLQEAAAARDAGGDTDAADEANELAQDEEFLAQIAAEELAAARSAEAEESKQVEAFHAAQARLAKGSVTKPRAATPEEALRAIRAARKPVKRSGMPMLRVVAKRKRAAGDAGEGSGEKVEGGTKEGTGEDAGRESEAVNGDGKVDTAEDEADADRVSVASKREKEKTVMLVEGYDDASSSSEEDDEDKGGT